MTDAFAPACDLYGDVLGLRSRAGMWDMTRLGDGARERGEGVVSLGFHCRQGRLRLIRDPDGGSAQTLGFTHDGNPDELLFGLLWWLFKN